MVMMYSLIHRSVILAGRGVRRHCGPQNSQRDEVFFWDVHTVHVLRANRTTVQYRERSQISLKA